MAKNGTKTPEALTILNTPTHSVTMDDVLCLVRGYMEEPRLHQIATTNPEFVMTAQKDDDFQRVLNHADLCIADGIGLVYASRYLGRPLPERVPGSELVYKLAELAARRGWRLFLLGAAPGVADEAAAIFQRIYPDLQIAGTYAGSPALAENEAIIEIINESRADMLFVAFGAPKQDKWIARNRDRLHTVRLALGVGGSLDFVSGRAVRAPKWIQNVGLEWLFRLSKEPWRWRRMLALPRFALKVLLSPKL
ncbi:MAG: WecB/TagA/CpsF family glycosyltransferase [Candidatus Promineifilaceae bacterium]|nr:WecB/TagA/CpsF family glycosyltransferase [Candidatus Promineifilaceae bacterium]